MHVLTKIFVVLVSLLAVLLVPLVVVYAHNEDAYKTRFERAEATASTLRADMTASQSSHAAELNRLSTELDEARDACADVEQARVQAESELRRLESRLAAEQSMKAEIENRLATLATGVRTSQDLIESLVSEVRSLRTDALSLQRQKIELDEALRDVTGQLEVAVQARRALQEELQRLRDELANATDQLGRAIAQGYNPQDDGVRAGAVGVAPTVSLEATVIGVRRSAGQVLAEIDAGSVDGLQVGWMLSVGRGGDFRGRIRLIEVDLNRSIGVVDLEDTAVGRTVEVGDSVYARPGRD